MVLNIKKSQVVIVEEVKNIEQDESFTMPISSTMNDIKNNLVKGRDNIVSKNDHVSSVVGASKSVPILKKVIPVVEINDVVTMGDFKISMMEIHKRRF